jgi:hypothetical protein
MNDNNLRPWERPIGDPKRQGRDIDQIPYDRQERRVVDYLHQITHEIGGGDDPIGFLIVSHAYSRHEIHLYRKVACAATKLLESCDRADPGDKMQPIADELRHALEVINR